MTQSSSWRRRHDHYIPQLTVTGYFCFTECSVAHRPILSKYCFRQSFTLDFMGPLILWVGADSTYSQAPLIDVAHNIMPRISYQAVHIASMHNMERRCAISSSETWHGKSRWITKPSFVLRCVARAVIPPPCLKRSSCQWWNSQSSLALNPEGIGYICYFNKIYSTYESRL